MFRALLFLLAVSLTLALPTASVAQENQRQRYIEGREQLDALIMSRSIGEAINFLSISNPMTDEDVGALNAKWRDKITEDFVAVDVVRSETIKGGFRHVMFAYWTESGQYLYTYILTHTRDNILRPIEFKYGRDFHALFGLF